MQRKAPPKGRFFRFGLGCGEIASRRGAFLLIRDDRDAIAFLSIGQIWGRPLTRRSTDEWTAITLQPGWDRCRKRRDGAAHLSL